MLYLILMQLLKLLFNKFLFYWLQIMKSREYKQQIIMNIIELKYLLKHMNNYPELYLQRQEIIK